MDITWKSALPDRRSPRAGTVVGVGAALDLIPDGSRVYVAPLCGVPTELDRAMAEGHDRWTRIELITDYLIDPLAVFDHAADPFFMTSLQPTRALGVMAAADALRRIPANYSQYSTMMAPGGPLEVDVAMVQVSPPGPDGRFSLGVSAGSTADIVRMARIVIAEVNPAMPYTFGATECDRDMFDALVEVEHPLVELASADSDAVTEAIGVHAAGEIDDGAVLQFGIGAVPQAILARLGDRTDLGMHGGIVGDIVIDLVESGAMTGARKTIDAGQIVAGGAIGTKRCFDWVHGNRDIVMVSSAYSHGVPVLAALAKLTAVNSAIEVSLDGSVNAEAVGDRTISGPGGQPDFAVAASLSSGGRSIIAFPSTASRGTKSRIVRHLALGTPTTVPRYLADRIVTEFGVARLRGLPLEDRPAALAAIAHRDFSGDLLA